MKAKIGITLLLMVGAKELIAQKETQKLEQIWVGYFNQTHFSNKWGAWLDVQLRTKDHFTDHLSQLLFRSALTYYVKDAIRTSAGVAYARYYPADNHSKVTQPEWRPWQQVQWYTKCGRNSVIQWFRLDERFRRNILNDSALADGYSFNFRLRYNFSWKIPLSAQVKKGSWTLVLNDEIHVNFGKQITYNYFDQNRFFVGFAFNTTATDNIQMGYMNVFQQLPAGNKYRSTDVARAYYFHYLDLRKRVN